MEEEGGKKRNKTQTTEQRETKSHEMNHLQHHQHHHHHDLQQEQNKIRISTTSPILSRELRRLVFTLIHLFQKNKPRFHCCCYFYSRKKIHEKRLLPKKEGRWWGEKKGAFLSLSLLNSRINSIYNADSTLTLL